MAGKELEKLRSGITNVDAYIEKLEEKVNAINGSNTLRLITSIDSMAGKIATDIDMMANGQQDEEGNDVEISHKIVDTFIKLIDKSDKIKSFSEVVEALRSLDEVKEEGSVGESIFEKTERRIKSKLNGKAN
jgi:2-oxo-4-hydroxy-4-carboxy--5-ureidoimidazoline (OHCU) decarboxylase